MSTEQPLLLTENIIDYTFRKDRKLLLRALTAAGAVEEDWDGNRKLAQLGTGLTRFLLTHLAYEANADRECTNDFKCSLGSKKQLAIIAQRTGIDRCITYSEKPGARSGSVLAKAINAIVGAVFLDCGYDIAVVLGVMLRLGVLSNNDQTVDPGTLSLDQTLDSTDVVSLASVVFRHGFNATSSSSLKEQVQPQSASIRPSSIQTDTLTQNTHWPETLAVVNDQHEHSRIPQDDICSENADLECFLAFPSPDESRGSLSGSSDYDDSIMVLDENIRGSTEAVVKRKAAPLQERQQRKRIQNIEILQARDDTISNLMAEEAKRFEVHASSREQGTFFTPNILEVVRELHEANVVMLIKVMVFIASPQSIFVLQEMLRKSNTRGDCGVNSSDRPLSVAERFSLVKSFDQKISYYQFLRRYHVLKLYIESGGPATRSTSGFVVDTPQSFVNSSKKAGNPSNGAEANVTLAMMAEIFPDVRPHTAGYDNLYVTIKELRKLGKRLYMLQEKFGKGVLGLMPTYALHGEVDFGISDRMITKPTDSEFKELIELLDMSQGNKLRDFSAAVAPIVEALITSPYQQYQRFTLESLQPSDILGLPKGSPELLDLICGTQ